MQQHGAKLAHRREGMQIALAGPCRRAFCEETCRCSVRPLTVDSFARDNLPPPEQWPDFLLDGFDYPESPQRRGRTHRPHGRARLRRPRRADRPRAAAHLQGADRLDQPARARAGRGLRRQARQPRADPLRQQSRDDRLLARRDQGRRRRRQHDADAARGRTRRRSSTRRRSALALCDTRILDELVACAKDSRFLKSVVGFDGTANHDAELDRVALNKPVRFEAVNDRPRRRRAARLHLGHDRLAEGDDAFPSRYPDHRRRLRKACAASHARRRVRRLAADRLHLRARRPRRVSAALRRRRGADRKRHAAEPDRDHRDLQGDDLLHRADRLSRHARRDGRGRRSFLAAARRFRRRNAAGAGLSRTGRNAPACRSSTASARPKCCMCSSPTGSTIRAPGSTGLPVPGYEAKVVDEEFNEVPRGAVGRLAVRGPTGCRYLADERQKRLRARTAGTSPATPSFRTRTAISISPRATTT